MKVPLWLCILLMAISGAYVQYRITGTIMGRPQCTENNKSYNFKAATAEGEKCVVACNKANGQRYVKAEDNWNCVCPVL